MAAVFALVFLFVLASVVLLFKVFVASVTVMNMLALAIFVIMASGVFVGLFKMTKDWEHESDVKH